MSQAERSRSRPGENNKLLPEDRAAHDWYRFVLSFPPHLVRDYLQRFKLTERHRVLDPFCGTGTTLVECKKLGIPSVGIEANPMAHFATAVKVDWTPDGEGLSHHAHQVGRQAIEELKLSQVDDIGSGSDQSARNPISLRFQSLRALDSDKQKLLLKDSISPLPLHKTLVLLDHLTGCRDERFRRHELLALARVLVTTISNLHFGPEVGVRGRKADAPVVASWLTQIRAMADDLQQLRGRASTPAVVHHADSRQMRTVVEPCSIDAVITSPPYPNEKDYTRTTRLESVILGFIRDKTDLQMLRRRLIRSNTRGVYKGDEDDHWVADHPEIQRIAEDIEARRIELGKTSGFERLYARTTRLYFGGMAKHLADLRTVLRPGARLAYVVGDQASYLRIMIRTGRLLADIAQSLGYEVDGIDLFRTRAATATKEHLREEVVLLRWPRRSVCSSEI